MLRRRLRFQAGDSLTNSSWVEGSMGGSGRGRGGDGAVPAEQLAGAEIIDCRSEWCRWGRGGYA